MIVTYMLNDTELLRFNNKTDQYCLKLIILLLLLTVLRKYLNEQYSFHRISGLLQQHIIVSTTFFMNFFS